MAKDLCKFDLLMVTEGYRYVDSIGMMIYTRCPNFNLHFASDVPDGIRKMKLHDPDVIFVDETLLKAPRFRELEEILSKSKGFVCYIAGDETYNHPVRSTATSLTLAETISGDDLEKRLGTLAEELLWRKLLFAKGGDPAEKGAVEQAVS